MWSNPVFVSITLIVKRFVGWFVEFWAWVNSLWPISEGMLGFKPVLLSLYLPFNGLLVLCLWFCGL